jgi:hypothetical protein
VNAEPLAEPTTRLTLIGSPTIATLWIPQDITLQELRVECFFPTDDETASVLRAQSAEANPGRRTPERLALLSRRTQATS